MMERVKKAIGIIIGLALCLYLVPRMVSKSTIAKAEAFLSGEPEGPSNLIKIEKVHGSIGREYPAARHTVLDTEFRDEKIVETPSGNGAQYEGIVTAEVLFPEGIAPECLPSSPNRRWGCKFVDVPPVPMNGTIKIEGVLKLKRDMPEEPWKGGVVCCMKRVD